MGRTIQNIIFGYDENTKEFMKGGLCAALTCKWLELCNENKFMPFRKEVGEEGVRIAYGPYDDEEAYLSQNDFIEILTDLFDEEYPSYKYTNYEILRVVGK
jgi:hypothetical protein